MWAAYFVGIALILDFLDGFTARLLKVSSPIGKGLLGKKADWKINFHFSDSFKTELEGVKYGAIVMNEPLVIDPKCIQQLLEKGAQSESIIINKSGEIGWNPRNAF